MNHNKTTKYLKYAIGEIVLVVIGILIALGINNWNQSIKENELESDFYCRILQDFELDKESIANRYTHANNRIEVSKQLLYDLHTTKKDKNYLLNKFLVSLRSDAYIPIDATYKDLISSGNIKFLKDLDIKNSLIQYYSELENKKAQLEQNRQKKIDLSFDLVNNTPGFDFNEVDYIKRILGPELLDILPKDSWEKNKESIGFKKFQKMITFNLAMADREKQHLNAIEEFMKVPYHLLKVKCNSLDD